MALNKAVAINIGQGVSLMLGLTTIPTWKSAERPKKAKAGTIGFNSQTSSLEYWDGTFWFSVPMSKI